MKKILSTNCLITSGFNRSLICDLLNSTWWTIPNSLAQSINDSNFDLIEEMYPDFFSIMQEKQMIVEIPESDLQLFPDFNTEFYYPGLVENAILDWKDNESDYSILDTVIELEKLGCKSILLRFYSIFDLNLIPSLFDGISDSAIEKVSILMPYKVAKSNLKFFKHLKAKNARFGELTLHSCPLKISSQINNLDWIQCTRDIISSCHSCGQISRFYFTLNIPHYTLTKNFNNCLYKKIGIDTTGNIKNCPSSNHSFGRLGKIRIEDAIKDSLFSSISEIRKDQIEICRICEFRSICSDCRIYTDNPNSPFSRPSKCNYNPYISLWKGEEGYKSLPESGVTFDSRGKASINLDKIAELNKEIWEVPLKTHPN